MDKKKVIKKKKKGISYWNKSTYITSYEDDAKECFNEAIKELSKSEWISVKDSLPPVDEETIVFTSDDVLCFGHIVDKKIAKDYNGWNIPNVEYWLPFVNPKDK